MTPQQRAELAERWNRNPYSVRTLFDGNCALPVEKVLAHLRGCNLTPSQAVGWLAVMTQVGRLQMISLDLVQLGTRVELSPEFASQAKT